MVHRITPTHWPPIIWLIFFPALASLIAASRVKQDAELWTWPADLGPATALSEPALLADPPAVLWRTDAALVYQTLDGSHAQQEILRYPDVHPRRWQVAPAERGRYHIVWLEDNNRLRSALISTDGETLRGPILLADAIRPDFVTVPAGESLIVVWINDHADEVNALAIDPAGRPGPITNIPVNRVSRVAAARDEANTLHLAWLTAPTPGTWAVHYQAVSATSLNMNSPITMQSLSLAPGESITGLEMSLDVSHGYILLGTSDAQTPDEEHVRVLSFPLGSPASVQFANLSPSGYALRWPRPAPGQHPTLALAVQVRTRDGWRPAVVTFSQGSTVDFDVAAPLPANSGPPALLADPSGSLILAWTGLDGVEPHLYVTRTTGTSRDTTGHDSAHVLIRTLAGAGVGLVLVGVWLLLPCCLLWLAPNNAPFWPLALALFTAAKLIWPADLFSRLPLWMTAAEFDRYGSPAGIMGLVVLLVGLAAGVAWTRARGWNNRRRVIIYLLTDAMLTILIFGTNLFR